MPCHAVEMRFGTMWCHDHGQPLRDCPDDCPEAP